MTSSTILLLLSVFVAYMSATSINARVKNSAEDKGIQFGRRNLNPNMNSLFFGKRSADDRDMKRAKGHLNPNVSGLFFGKRDYNPLHSSTFFGKRDHNPLHSSTFFGKRDYSPLTSSTFFGKRSGSGPSSSDATAALSVLAAYIEDLESMVLTAQEIL